MPIIAGATLAVVEEWLSNHLSHTEIDNLMEQYGFEYRDMPQLINKLNKIRGYFRGADWSDGRTVKRFLDLLTRIFARMASSSYGSTALESNPGAQRVMKVLAEREGITWDGEKFHPPASAALIHTGEAVQEFNLTTLDAEVRRILGNITSDPEDTITSAKSLLESTCREVLSCHGETPPRTADILDLLKAVFERLQLLPEGVDDEARGTDAMRKVIRSVTAAVQGLAELRNLYGDSHGKGPGHKGLEARHARLLAALACAVATFVLETHEKMG